MTFVGIMTDLLKIASDHVELGRLHMVDVNNLVNVIDCIITLIDHIRIQSLDRLNIAQIMSFSFFKSGIRIMTEQFKICSNHFGTRMIPRDYVSCKI